MIRKLQFAPLGECTVVFDKTGMEWTPDFFAPPENTGRAAESLP